MAFVVRLTIKKSAESRKLLGTRHAYLQRYTGGRYRVAAGNSYKGSDCCATPVSLEDAEKFTYRYEAVDALADYIKQTQWTEMMWVKAPQIVEVAQ